MHDKPKTDPRLGPLATLIHSIDRPGEYCTHGRFLAPMPRIRIGAGDTLSFPVPAAQVKTMIGVATPAPYGRGPETIVDRAVRDCWQIEPGQIDLGGQAWSETFGNVLERVTEGLGCPPDAISASLYKVLVYEVGGFFAPHRDTEKVDGMVGTLVVSLPAAGAGGELIVRHKDRETVVDMRTDEPSELVYTAFYADCEHEIRPVTVGHRICLVYNLVLNKGKSAPTKAPDYSSKVVAIADELRNRYRDPETTGKFAWILEHDYSEAGFSFATLKNTDNAVAQVLVEATRLADCALHAAIVHIEESASVDWYGDWVREAEDVDESNYEVTDIESTYHWLDGWVRTDDTPAEYGKLDLDPEELLDEEAFKNLESEPPDSQRLFEATGNGGASVERLYRRAALVIWHQANSLEVLAPAGAGALVSFLGAERDREQAGATTIRSSREWAASMVEAWPMPPRFYSASNLQPWWQHCAKALRLLHDIGNRAALSGFLENVVVPRYGTPMNDALAVVMSQADPKETGAFLDRLARSHLGPQPDGILDLVCRLCEKLEDGSPTPWQSTLRETVLVICSELPAVCRPPENRNPGAPERQPDPLSADTVGAFFRLVWRYGLEKQATEAASFFIDQPGLVSPDRCVPALLMALREEHGDRIGEWPAFEMLWRRGAAFLLNRSNRPPGPPTDWLIPTDGLPCKCEHCDALREFCRDPEASVRRFAVRQDLREHLRSQIRSSGIDMRYQTERKGSPHKLVCTKTRGSHERRLKEYETDVTEMRRLLDLARIVPGTAETARDLDAALGRAEG